MPEQAFRPTHTSEGRMIDQPRTPFQDALVAFKERLEDAKAGLLPHEWHTLRSCLLIWLQADEEREDA